MGKSRAPARPHQRVVLQRIPYDAEAWQQTVDTYADAEVFHTSDWLGFLKSTQRVEPVTAEVIADGRVVGHFVGAVVVRFGIRILGSPLSGWGTQCMGFLLRAGADRRAAAEALVPFAFDSLGCVYIELGDRHLRPEEMRESGYVTRTGTTFVVDLTIDEVTAMNTMRKTTRNYIRQAERKGLVADASGGIGFVEEYYAQLVDVFARQGLSPTYSRERVHDLVRYLAPSGKLAMLRVRGPDGSCIATSISLAGKRIAVLWGTASAPSALHYHPNELLHWRTMQHWRSRGLATYDMGGGGAYKAKYGGVERASVRFHRYRYPFLRHGRAVIRYLIGAKQRIGGLRHQLRHRVSAERPPVGGGTLQSALRHASAAGCRYRLPGRPGIR